MMKFKIDTSGHLWTKRARKWKIQTCPILYSIRQPCGDWCPLFDDSDIINPAEMGLGLCLCQANYPDADVIDERE
jgi:hypothetical protein